MPGRYRFQPPCADADPTAARSAAASACCPASGGCACRCRGRACRTATPGRSPRATGSSSSTPACTSPARSATSSARWARSTCGSSTSGCSSARTRTPTTTARRRTIVERAGCELWMHPNHEHMTAPRRDPEAALHRRIEVARQCGVPGRALRARPRPRARAPASPARRARPRPRARRRGRHRPRHLVGPRDARPRAVARLPLPARAPAADLRRPPARPRLAVLRLRLHARPGRRVPGLARRGRRARRAARAWPATAAPFTDVRGAHRAPTARSCASASTRCRGGARRPARAPPSTRPDVYGEPITPDERQLVADRDALLPDPPRGHRRACGAIEGRRRSAGRGSVASLSAACGSTSASAAAGAEPVFSFEFFPPKTDDGARNLVGRAGGPAHAGPDFVSVTYGAGGSTRDKTIEIVTRIEGRARPRGDGAPHLRRRDRATSCAAIARPDARARASRTCWRCAATRRGEERVDRDRRAACAYSPRADRADPRATTTSRSARACFPETHIHATTPRTTCATSKEKVDAGRAVPDHAALLRQPLYFDFVARARAIGDRRCRSSRASCRSPTSAQIERITEHVRRVASRTRLQRGARRARRRPERGRRARRRATRPLQCARAARRRRARHPLLHAQPLTGDARDPQRAALYALAPAEGQHAVPRSSERVSDARLPSDAVTRRRPCRSCGRCRCPTRRGTSATAPSLPSLASGSRTRGRRGPLHSPSPLAGAPR